jgi:hypothetical protein
MLLADKFLAAYGHADPATDRGFDFNGHNLSFFWDELYGEIGAGWYLDRFLYLFGEEVRTLDRCLEYWDFLMPQDNKTRWVIGRNAYGALLVIEDPLTLANAAPIGLLDPLTVSYSADPNMVFTNLIGYWLPERRLNQFLDTRLFDAWRKHTDDVLELDEILAIQTPLPLGGEMIIDNFNIEDVFDYYQTTGDIYRSIPTLQRS